MVTLQKKMVQRIVLSTCMLLLAMLLAACSGLGGTASSTPTPSAPTPTPSPTTPAAAFQTYTGTTFTISYPQGAQKTSSGNQVTFLDPTTKNVMTIVTVPNPGGVAGASTVSQTSMSEFEKTLLSNAKPATIAPTASVGGDSWVQSSATGNLAVTDPGTPGTLVLLVDNHPANSASTMTYEIVYYGPTATWSQANTVFQAMLQSFKFTA